MPVNGTSRLGAGLLRVSWLTIVLLADPQSLPCAQEIGKVTAGRHLAENWCSGCHLVSPEARQVAGEGVPTFAAIAQMKSTTLLSLRAFLETPHSRMPDLRLTHDQIEGHICVDLKPASKVIRCATDRKDP